MQFPSSEKEKNESLPQTNCCGGHCARALTFVALPTAAMAGEYCLTNTSGMRGCGFESIQQCLNSLSGTAGTCARDPFYQDPHSALAYKPMHSHSHTKKTVEK
jgi:Protein of unknown function (DUF3551)